MRDGFGREINYMRLSVTSRCNLRCRYCMPEPSPQGRPGEELGDGELLAICAQAVKLGITRFKLTGGEPLLRPGLAELAAQLKALEGVEEVTLTTNGVLLAEQLDGLCRAGLDGVNVSLDALDPQLYQAITGRPGAAAKAMPALLAECVRRGLRTKVNVVLLEENLCQVAELALLGRELPVDVRFIQLMPIGWGAKVQGVPPERALAILKERWPDLHPVQERRGNGPASYFATEGLRGRVGLIAALSRRFCAQCNRVRLTSTGGFKPCLCYRERYELGLLLRGGAPGEALGQAMAQAILQKPWGHCFEKADAVTEALTMDQIGG